MIVSTLSFAFAGILFVILGVPMMRRRVPPNGAYGLRVPATFADEWVWYEANALSGRDFVYLGAVIAVLALVLPFVPGMSDPTYSLALVTLLVGGTIWIAVAGWRRANRMLRERQEQERRTGGT
jgi:uncharacterized membrane protein